MRIKSTDIVLWDNSSPTLPNVTQCYIISINKAIELGIYGTRTFNRLHAYPYPTNVEGLRIRVYEYLNILIKRGGNNPEFVNEEVAFWTGAIKKI